MTSDQIRCALTKMHQTRGKLMAFCNTHKLNYNLIIKFLNDPKRQLWHDNAQRIIDALPDEYRLEGAI
ncbi:hypothetical protein [Pseudoalteromonas rubra]|uniref:hypothetical protein n=1 Tax=Pseudoalteromonas rubra TaxID=43658 RepID=UPI002DB77E72|nr:hypothetical protein [Pseudoalteromonas rubra]MEC4090122.1 hypothetical protein [Pseudoalteromonas rubra]